ncbi:MAG: guanine deaminase [Rhodobacteraceae bacterium]|nr:guanine deaminase [Paracoccaceae bacterium]
MTTLLLGQTLSFSANPWQVPVDDAVQHVRRGAVLIDGGLIRAVGPADDLKTKYPEAKITDYGDHLIIAGFIDSHAHFSQTAIIASWGKRLIDWLNTYTFPEETRFHDAKYAAQVAETYLDLNLSNGITTACAYCTIHPESVDAYFTAAQKRGLRMMGGKVMMDRNAPDGLRDTAQSGYDDSKALLRKWHGKDRLSYVITPRFAPTSTETQLEATGALWAQFPDCLMQTHLSEQSEEIAWVRDLFPDQQDYLAVYEHFGLTGPGAVLGHSIYLSDREWSAIRDGGSSLAHCPTSNAFIGSGLFNATKAHEMKIPTGLATDVGGGSSFSMLRTMASAYEIGQLRGDALHPAQLLWMATQGSADALHVGNKIGNLVAGREADIVVIDMASTPVIEQRVKRAEDFWEQIFPTIMLGDDRAISAVWVNGSNRAD